MSAVIFLLISLGILLLRIGIKYYYNYWGRYGIPSVGNIGGGILSMTQSSAEYIQELYNRSEGSAFVGMHVFHKPAVLLRDPELIKRILVRDFSKFNNRYSNADIHGDPIGSQNIFFLRNPAWKDVRLKLTPFFTAARMKQMFLLVDEVGRNLEKCLSKYSENEIEMKEFCARYTTDVIATVAFGVEANSMQNPDSEFRTNGRAIFKFGLWRAIQFVVVFFLPQLVRLLRVRVVPQKETEFIRSTINFVLQQREKSNVIRNDLIDILLEFRNASKKNENKNGLIFDGDLLVAQAALFFTAGFESSSATMSFALYELAIHTELQDRVREEIKEALMESKGVVTMKVLDSLPYMQMVITEVLRLYPPLPFLDRECTAQSYSMEPFDKFSLPCGMPVYIPVYGLHMDPKYYPEPKEFNPERFSPENKHRLTPYTYLPFGIGGHACVGERFAMMQTKIGLLYMLRNHRVTATNNTKQPMQIDPKAIILQAAGGIHLKIVHNSIGV